MDLKKWKVMAGIMKRMLKNGLSFCMVLAGLLLLTGCGEKMCHFEAQDAAGLTTGAPVMWYDMFVGTVEGIEAMDGGASAVRIRFDSRYENAIHDGVAARVVADPKIAAKPFVLLVGGKDVTRPVLGRGVRIPESQPGNAVQEGFASFDGWLKGARTEELVVVGGLLGFLTLFFKRIGKFFRRLIVLLIVGLVAYICYTLHSDWQSHKASFADVKAKSQEAADWVVQNGEKLKALLSPIVAGNED